MAGDFFQGVGEFFDNLQAMSYYNEIVLGILFVLFFVVLFFLLKGAVKEKVLRGFVSVIVSGLLVYVLDAVNFVEVVGGVSGFMNEILLFCLFFVVLFCLFRMLFKNKFVVLIFSGINSWILVYIFGDMTSVFDVFGRMVWLGVLLVFVFVFIVLGIPVWKWLRREHGFK